MNRVPKLLFMLVASAVMIEASAAVGAPTISSISPSSVVGSNTASKTFTITGTNFTSQSIVYVGFRDNGYSQTANPKTPTFNSSMQLTFSVVVGADADTWKVWVKDGGVYSNQGSFTVTAPSPTPSPTPTGTPTISSISPSSVVGSDTASKTFTITGTNFTSQSIVYVGFRDNGYSQTANPKTPTFNSSTQLTFSVVVGADADTWKVWVKNGTVYSNQGSFTVTAPSPTPSPTPTGTPTITSISPSSVVGSDTASKTFTITGTNFTSQSIVYVGFRDNGYSQTANPKTPTFNSSTQLTFSVVVGADADTWKVWVKNGTVYSNQGSFIVTAPSPTPSPTPTGTPTITSISPSSVVGSDTASKTFTITGTNFTSQSIVYVGFRDNGYSQTANPKTPTFNSSTQLTFSVVVGADADTWKVWVKNGTVYSNQGSFTVTAPSPTPSATPTATPTPAGPVIASVTPNPVPGSLSSQPFAINGSNFTATSVVNLRNLTTGTAYLSRTVTSQTSTRLVINPVFGTEAHSWSVEVVNGTASSGQYPFQVNSPTPSLSITSILPSAVQQKDWGQSISYTVTVHDLQGKAVQGASVTVNDGVKSQSIQASITNSDGQSTYQTSVPVGKNDGPYQISFQASAPGYITSSTISRQVEIQHVTPTVKLISPNGGENWSVGSTQTIKATTSGAITTVRFEYSKDGEPWQAIGSPVQVLGSETPTQWRITSAASTAYSIRVTAVYAQGSVQDSSDAPFSVIVVPSGNNCSPIMTEPPLKQTQAGDATWLALDDRPQYRETISQSGCFLACLSMILSQLDPPHPYSVDALNTRLASTDAFARDTHKLDPVKAVSYASSSLRFQSFDDWKELYQRLGFDEFLKELVCNQKVPVIVDVGGGAHYVVVTGKDDIGWVINDPGHGAGYFATTLHLNDPALTTKYGSSRSVRGYVARSQQLFAADRGSETGPFVPNEFHAAVSNNADVGIIDPAGNFTGIDPTSKEQVEQIPTSAYFVDAEQDPETGAPAKSANHTVYIGQPASGLYEVRVYGSANGPFTLALTQLADDGVSFRTNYIQGMAQVGSVDSFFVNIGGSANLSLTSSASSASARIGESLAYTLTVTNVSSNDASAVTIIDTLPTGVSLVSVEGAEYVYDPKNGTVIVTFYTLGAGASATVRLTVIPTQAGVLTNRATVSSVEADIDSSDNSNSDNITVAPLVVLGNISTRLDVATGDNALIGGFIVSGTLPKKVVVRGIGPSLANFGLSGVLADPTLELHDSSQVIATNNDWQSNANKQEIIDANVAPSDPKEAAILTTLNPGAYTVILKGADNGTGIGTVEVYDLDQTVDSKLGNISTRGFVDTGDNVMIGGTIVTGSASTNVLIRAIGPSLTNFGVPNALQDPTLELHDAQGGIIAMNDNWMDSPDAAAAIAATGLQPSNIRESAIVANVAPGAYTAIVRGTGNSTGVALVEAYQLP